jgi:capsular exopolysaccharide synthesis family protein
MVNHISTSNGADSHPGMEIAKLSSHNGFPGSNGHSPSTFASEEGGGGGGFQRYIHAFRRRWLLSLVLALLVAPVVTAISWTLIPPSYSAFAMLQLKSGEQPLAFTTVGDNRGSGSQGGSTFEIFKKTQKEYVKSRYVLARALDSATHKGLADLPVLRDERDQILWLETYLSVTFPGDAEFMKIALTASTPTGLDEIIKAVVDEYLEEVVFSEYARKLNRLNKLEKAHDGVALELRTKQSDLRKLKNTLSPDEIADQMGKDTRQFSTMLQNISSTKFEIKQVTAELERLSKLIAAEDPTTLYTETELAQAVSADLRVVALEGELSQLSKQIDNIRRTVDEKKAVTRIAEIERKVDAVNVNLERRKKDVEELLPKVKRTAAKAEIEGLEKKLLELQNREKHYASEYAELQKKAIQAGIAASSIDVLTLEGEITHLETIFSGLRAELGKTRVELQPMRDKSVQSEGARVRLLGTIEKAQAAPALARVVKILGVGFLAFTAPFFIVVFLDARKDRISTHAEVTQAVGLSVIGAVPILPQRVMRRLNGPSERDKYWRTLLSESVDSIAAVLLRGAKSGTSRVIMVSSANAGEGKTTLAAHLAVSLAGAGCHPILVDFDLRRPALHRVFGLSLQPGVNEILREGRELETAIQATQIPNLMMLSAGRWNKSGLAGLAAADLKSLFDRLRAGFDFVIVDASPILPVVDTRLIGQHVDAVLLSVLRDVSRAPKLRAACDLLDLFGIPVLGVVVTGPREEVYKDARYDAISEAQAS